MKLKMMTLILDKTLNDDTTIWSFCHFSLSRTKFAITELIVNILLIFSPLKLGPEFENFDCHKTSNTSYG